MKIDTDALLDVVRQRFDAAIDADHENRDEALDDLEQLTGAGQWPDDIRNEREEAGRPCLTINRLPQFVRQVTGDIRQMNPAINIIPSDDVATDETAELVEGLVRHIQYDSGASGHYEWAAECAAACGIGFFRVVTEWEDDETFNQVIRIKPIKNPLSVYFDPLAEASTRSDAGWCFITSEVSHEEFERMYPGKRKVDAKHDAQVQGMRNWFNDKRVIVAEYYWKEPVKEKIALMEDGSVVRGDKVVAPLNAVRTRTVDTHKVMWAKVSGVDVLEGPTELPCKHIPVIAVTGEEWHIGDRIHRSGVIRYAKDPQRLYNYWRSAQTELVALQPKAPFLVTPKQIQGLEEFWKAANESNDPYLPYNPDEKAVNPPQRSTPPIASQGMMQEVLAAAEDMKATTGVYDAGLGNAGNEKSGVAIRQRQMESDVSTSIYADNMAKAIEHCGRIIVDMIPKVYDTARTLQIIGKGDAEQRVPVNGIMVTQDGVMAVNPLTIGKYAVKVSVGPNYATMRQETAERMIEFIQAVPQAGQVVADLIAKNMDWPGADEFAKRLKKLLPPGVIGMDELPPEEQEAARQATQQQQVEQQQQAALTVQAQEIEMRKAQAETVEAEADAEKARFETMKTQLEVMAQTGQLDAVISALVQEQVARALQGALAR